MQEECEKMEMNVSDNVGTNEMQEEMEKLKKSMHTEKMLKVQAINKLAEIVHRKDNLTRKDKKAESKASSAELRKREKENRKLQLELNTEKEKFNQMVSKTQKDLQDLQVILSCCFLFSFKPTQFLEQELRSMEMFSFNWMIGY